MNRESVVHSEPCTIYTLDDISEEAGLPLGSLVLLQGHYGQYQEMVYVSLSLKQYYQMQEYSEKVPLT